MNKLINMTQNVQDSPETPRQIRTARILAVLTLLPLLASGCTLVSYTTATGEHFSRGSLGANTSLSSLTVEAGTNGVRRVDLRGYQNDSSQALGAVTEAAVRAAVAGAAGH